MSAPVGATSHPLSAFQLRATFTDGGILSLYIRSEIVPGFLAATGIQRYDRARRGLSRHYQVQTPGLSHQPSSESVEMCCPACHPGGITLSGSEDHPPPPGQGPGGPPLQYGAAVAVDAPAKENAIARTKVATTVTVRLCDDLVRTLRCASPAGGFAEMLIKLFSSILASNATGHCVVKCPRYIDRRNTNPHPSGTRSGRLACAVGVSVSRHGQTMSVRRRRRGCLRRRTGKSKGGSQKKRRDHRHSAFV